MQCVIGSPEHKSGPSFAGGPAPRADASICDARFLDQQELLTEWLRESIRAGRFSEMEEGERFPRYVWRRHEGTVYEARLDNRELGEYKGYELLTEEWPEGL